MFPSASYDSETLELLTRALDEAWKDVQAVLIVKPLAPGVLRTRLANRIISAAGRQTIRSGVIGVFQPR